MVIVSVAELSFENNRSGNTVSVVFIPAAFQNGTCYVVNATSSSLTLQWTPVQSALYYMLTYYQNDVPHALNATATVATVSGLTPGNVYTISLQTAGIGGFSDKSNCTGSTGLPTLIVPLAPMSTLLED
jgi:hypothetical protein